MFDFDSILQKELDGIRKQGLFREMKRIDSMQGPTVFIDGREFVLLSSNNYLGLAGHPEIISSQIEAAKEFGAGSAASRLISGNMSLYERLEQKIADFKGTEASIVFPTGYMANVGTISALVGAEDIVICDKLNHASIIDGAKLSGARLRVYPHKNLAKLEDILKNSTRYRRKLIITDGIFSMDGDIAPLLGLAQIAERFDCILMLDDAHATGVLGKTGRGSCEYFGMTRGIHIKMGTLSKALGNLGGFIAGSRDLIDYIRNKARSFIYSTALPPAILSGSLKAIEMIEKDTSLIERLWVNIRKFRGSLRELGYDTSDSEAQIIPILTGDIDSAVNSSKALFDMGIFAPGIRPPTVARNKCRIRTSLMASHTREHIDMAIEAFKRLKNEGILRYGN